MPLTPGHKLAAYEIISALGAGGMGEVYRARDTRLGRDVALKILPPDVTNEHGRLERFDREARAIAALNHPHIVTIYSTEEADGMRFLTMELVDGPTLSELVVSSGMAIPRFLEIAIALADALAAAHQKHITHRDLKPGNVMISNDGRVKVLDFGLARVGAGDVGEHSLAATAAPITHQGMIIGTMPYMSPEQVEGRVIDARSDLFSLGVIFYELLSGKRPFGGGSSPALMSAILRDTPPPITATRADLPDGLERLVDRLIEKRPEDRVQTARDVFNELKHLRKQVESGNIRSSSVSGAAAAPPHNLWIAVLPFSVRGADHDAVELAAGLTDDVAASLAKFPVFNVVAAQSTRAYKDSALDVRQIADRLGARYVITGNVRTSARVVRTTAQLIDAPSGAQLWSESYDRDAVAMDLFAIQDDVTDHIVATIGDQTGVLVRSMLRSVRSRVPASEQTSRELLLRAWGLLQNPLPADHAELRAAIETRLTVEADNADLWAELAHIYLDEHILALNVLPDALGRASRAARRSVAIDPNNQNGWNEVAGACFFMRDAAGLFDAAERAVAINPRNAHSLGWMGNLYTHAGEYERGSKLAERAMAINPRHGGWMHFGVFNRHFAAGNYAEALQAARRVNIPQLNWNYFAIAAAAAHLGLSEEARLAAEKMIQVTPELAEPHRVREFTERWYWQPEMVDALLAGVHQARSSEHTNERSPERSSERPSERSIAVLPFTDLSEKKDQDWFCDGIAEEVMIALASLPGLRVAARASAFSFRGKTDDLRVIADKLNVTTVLEGSVRRAGDRVRITAQLSDARQGQQLWSERFDRELKDIFDVQDEIARAIADRLRISISGGLRLVQQATTNLDAYVQLLKGREFATRRGRAVLDAIPCFELALELDPNLAEAHALLADCYRLLGLYGIARASEVMPRAQASVDRAMALDPNQPEAMATTAIIACVYEWNIAEVRRRSDRALAADPNHVRALAERAISVACLEPAGTKWHQEVLDHIAKARALDPLSAWVMAIESTCQMLVGRVAESVHTAKRAVELDDKNFTAHWMHVCTLSEAGREDEALEAAVPGLAMSGRHPMILSSVAAIHSRRGEVAAAEAILNELIERSRIGFIGSAALATAAASAGQWPEARTFLTQAVTEHDPFAAFWKLDAWRPIWKDDQCAAILKATSLFQRTSA
jgi:TolB-like protein/Flp pilus assembly protein TadD